MSNLSEIHTGLLHSLAEQTEGMPPEEKRALLDVILEDLCWQAAQLDGELAERNERDGAAQIRTTQARREKEVRA